MSFMQPEVFETECYVVETDYGTEYVPVDVVGNIGNPDDEGFDPLLLADYCEGTVGDDTDAELVSGWAYRLSAPGYLDATVMGLADTKVAAYTELLDQYGTDDGKREEWELEALEIVIRAARPNQQQKLANWYGVDFDDEAGVSEIAT